MPPRRTRAMLAEALFQDADLLLFSAADCDPGAGLVTARRWRGGGYETVRVALPPLVVIISDAMGAGQAAVGDWIRAGTAVLDDRAPDKLEQVRLLETSALAAHAIPAEAADPARLEAQFADCLARWGAIVVKPVDGMRGGNVHFLCPAAGGTWALHAGRRAETGALPDLTRLLAARIGGRLRYRRFMIQEYVASTYRGMLAALRVDAVRSPTGEWRTIRPVVRIGAIPGSLVSNYAAGTAQIPWDRFFALSGVDPAIGHAAERLAWEASALVDGHPDGSLIETGVDILFSEDGHLRIVEVNARPESITWEQDRAAWAIDYYLSRVRHLAAPASRSAGG